MEPNDPPDFEFQSLSSTPEDLESQARRLPHLHEPLSEPQDWPTGWEGLGFRLRLPAGFVELEADSAELDADGADQVSWHHADGSAISLLVDDGGNLSVVGFVDADGVEVGWHDEGTFQVPLAGRTGQVGLTRVSVGTNEVFQATAQAGITTGLGIMVMVVAPTRDRRAALMNVIATVAVTSEH